MGTNYRLIRGTEPCVTCGHPTDLNPEVHIGKSSGGWVFAWHGYREGNSEGLPVLDSPSRWIEFLAVSLSKGGIIEDEYGHSCTLHELVTLIIRKRPEGRRATTWPGTPGDVVRHKDGDDILFHDFC